MKRIYLILILIVLLIVDNTIMPYYSINGACPSLLFVFAIAYSIIEDKNEAVFIGIVSGLLQDIFFFSGFGVNLLLNMLLCVLSAKIGASIFKENMIVPVITMLGVSILKVFSVVIILGISSQSINIQTALISAVLNTVCMAILYKFILKILDKYLNRNKWRF